AADANEAALRGLAGAGLRLERNGDVEALRRDDRIACAELHGHVVRAELRVGRDDERDDEGAVDDLLVFHLDAVTEVELRLREVRTRTVEREDDLERAVEETGARGDVVDRHRGLGGLGRLTFGSRLAGFSVGSILAR